MHKATTATTGNSGHVKLGTAAGTACQGNDSCLTDSRTPKSHASKETTYGTGTSVHYGHVKLSDTYEKIQPNGSADNGMAASQKAVADVYAELNSNLTNRNLYFGAYQYLPGACNLNNYKTPGRYCGVLYPSNVTGLPTVCKTSNPENAMLEVINIAGDIVIQKWLQVGTNNYYVMRYSAQDDLWSGWSDIAPLKASNWLK